MWRKGQGPCAHLTSMLEEELASQEVGVDGALVSENTAIDRNHAGAS